jgi:hypothetical protein
MSATPFESSNSPGAVSGAPEGGDGRSVSSRAPQAAIAPLNTTAEEDVAAGTARVDEWLREISGGYITLPRIQYVLGSLPIVGNVIAAVDVLCDIVVLVKNRAPGALATLLTWLSLGINLIGLIPAPPGMAAARMSLRPMLALVRQRLKEAGLDALSETIIELVAGHLNESIVGEIDQFVEDAQKNLSSILTECGAFANDLATRMANAQEKLARGEIFDAEENRESAKAANWVASKVMTREFMDRVLGIARKLREIGGAVRGRAGWRNWRVRGRRRRSAGCWCRWGARSNTGGRGRGNGGRASTCRDMEKSRKAKGSWRQSIRSPGDKIHPTARMARCRPRATASALRWATKPCCTKISHWRAYFP